MVLHADCHHLEVYAAVSILVKDPEYLVDKHLESIFIHHDQHQYGHWPPHLHCITPGLIFHRQELHDHLSIASGQYHGVHLQNLLFPKASVRAVGLETPGEGSRNQNGNKLATLNGNDNGDDDDNGEDIDSDNDCSHLYHSLISASSYRVFFFKNSISS